MSSQTHDNIFTQLMCIVGRSLVLIIDEIKSFNKLLLQSFFELGRKPYRFRLWLDQIEFVANQSLFLILFCVCFAAMVTILESSFHMKLVIQNDSMVPGFAAMLILRELGAVVTALLLTARVGAGMTAEIATMKTTEQIEALKMLGIRPIQYLVVPRWIGCIVGSVLLTIIANLACLIAAQIVSEIYLGFPSGLYLTALRRFIHSQDLLFAAIKGACFGFVIPLISCHFGFRCKNGAEGVGQATTRSVVTSSVAVIVIDFVLSYIFSFLYN